MKKENLTVVTSGSAYLDIDAYACIIAMSDLLELQGKNAIPYSNALYNYSVVPSLTYNDKVVHSLPIQATSAEYIIVDVSDPNFLEAAVSIDRIVEVYDHHVGFESYWFDKIGNNSHIEFIGAAATLIYSEWKKFGLHKRMSIETAKLLAAAILDNTLNLNSNNTTKEDIEAFDELCKHIGAGDEFRSLYFSEVQKLVENDLKNAIFGDIKRVSDNNILPPDIGQISVWNAEGIIRHISEIREWFKHNLNPWMINLIDIERNCSYFICDDLYYQSKIEQVFNVRFESGVARSDIPYLRKEIIKKTKC